MGQKLTNSKRLNYLLGEMGIFTSRDVIRHLPKRYDDFTYSKDKQFVDKQRVVIFGKVISLPKLVSTKKIKIISFDFLSENKKYFRIVSFNREYLLKTIDINEQYTVVGHYDKNKNEINLIHAIKGKIDPLNMIKPIYSLPSDFRNDHFVNLVKRSLDELKDSIFNTVPYEFINKYRLINKEQAFKNAHTPTSYEDIRQAHRHLKYEEALLFSLKNQLIKEENKSLSKIKKEPIDLDICHEFLSSLPYSLTDDQINAAKEIIEDMNQSSLMYRLLQGDVGTGKTLVSFIALYANYYRGDQGALMAPTDALAKQHYLNALEIFKPFKINIALLVGSTPLNEKKRIYQDLEDGTIDIVIGTHALFSKSVKYSSLGLAIIDEQHRFGVNQRITLLDKGKNTDLLMMSATPIPRSLALTLYGDLDISTLYQFPNKKRNVITKIINSEDEIIYEKVKKSIDEFKNVYIVAPLIDYREDGRFSAEKLYARFALKFGKKVGLLHGKMAQNDKEKALDDFYNGITPILVTTPVIEVGIDVKNANLMVIYDANNFGLASLHQLRGRIGRDGSGALCYLAVSNDEENAKERLQILEDSDDGFVIAEKDLSIRGPGELQGNKQSGLPNFCYLNVVSDLKIFMVARDDAKTILNNQDKKGYSYIINYAKKEIVKNPLIKG